MEKSAANNRVVAEMWTKVGGTQTLLCNLALGKVAENLNESLERDISYYLRHRHSGVLSTLQMGRQGYWEKQSGLSSVQRT